MRGLPKGMGLEFSDNRTAQSPVTLLVASINALPETAGEGAVAATLSIIGADYVAPASFTIISDPSGFFEIVDDELLVGSGVTFDYETTSSYTVSIEGADGVPNTYSKTIQVLITNINEAPTDLSLDATSITEEAEIGDVVANISSSGDPDAGDTATYTIISDPDNKFLISGTQLKVNGALDYATATSHDVTIRVSDSGGLFYDELSTIDVTQASTGFDVLALTGIKGWGKTNDLSTITDTAGSVSQINDKSGNGNHWTQPTASKQPQTGVATVNGKNVVSFSGGTEHMINTWVPTDENWSVVCVRRGAQTAGGSSMRHVIAFPEGVTSEAAASMNAQRLGTESNNKLSYWAKNGSAITYSTILWAENQVSGLIMNWRKNTDVTTYIDGSVATNIGDTTLAPTEISLMGSPYENSRGCIGDVCETIFGEGTLSPAEIAGISTYFVDEWGTA